jgi:hypothetical protein
MSSLDFYRMPEGITKIEKHLDFIAWLTDDVRAIFQVVQGILVHDNWLHHYGITLRSDQVPEAKMAYMEDLLDKAVELDSRSLSIPRSPEQRVICCCREFATLFCAILRHKGIPARSRCGFSTYLAPPLFFEDHWICEYWSEAEERWVMVDPQIDPFQQSTITMEASPLDIPDTYFHVAGRAWKWCREGVLEPERFGIACDPAEFGLESLYGLWFVRGQLLRDFAALNKVEMVPFLAHVAKGHIWDPWRLVAAKDEELSEEDYALLDAIADLSLDPDAHFDQVRETYQQNPDLQPPREIIST